MKEVVRVLASFVVEHESDNNAENIRQEVENAIKWAHQEGVLTSDDEEEALIKNWDVQLLPQVPENDDGLPEVRVTIYKGIPDEVTVSNFPEIIKVTIREDDDGLVAEDPVKEGSLIFVNGVPDNE